MTYQGRVQSSTARPVDQQQVETTTGTGGWAWGFAIFAGVMMIMIGTFQAFEGLAAIINDDLFVVTGNYAFEFDTTAWGWIHMIAGIVVAIAGFYVFTGNLLARIIGILMCLASAVINFFYIPYYPVWSVLIIALNIVVIAALATMPRPESFDNTTTA